MFDTPSATCAANNNPHHHDKPMPRTAKGDGIDVGVPAGLSDGSAWYQCDGSANMRARHTDSHRTAALGMADMTALPMRRLGRSGPDAAAKGRTLCSCTIV